MNKVMVSNNLKQDSTFQKQKMFKKMKKWNIDLRIRTPPFYAGNKKHLSDMEIIFFKGEK